MLYYTLIDNNDVIDESVGQKMLEIQNWNQKNV